MHLIYIFTFINTTIIAVMESKLDKKKIEAKLKKYSSDVKFKTIEHHTLNKSPSKNVPSFQTGSLRFHKYLSFSPNKFYNLPQTKTKKAVSFGYGSKTNFQRKQFIQPTRYKVLSSFDLKELQRKPGPTFGISRLEIQKGKWNKEYQTIGPGSYEISGKLDKKGSFHIGVKINRKNSTQSPGPAAYNVLSSSNITQRKQSMKGPIIRTQYFQKSPMKKYDNSVPGPGAYDLNATQTSMRMSTTFDKTKSKFPQCPRFRIRDNRVPSPGHYNSFSVFGS